MGKLGEMGEAVCNVRRIRLCRRATGAADVAKGAKASGIVPLQFCGGTVLFWRPQPIGFNALNSGGLGAEPPSRGIAKGGWRRLALVGAWTKVSDP